MSEDVHPLKLASLLLQYPSEDLRAAATAVAGERIEPASRRTAKSMREFAGWYAATSLDELELLYVESFDFDKRASLHLTYHVHGDRRQRGVALLRLKQAYRAAGFEPPEAELPDYLPLMLEFASLAVPSVSRELLGEHRVALELIRRALADDESPFVVLLDVAVAGLGKPSQATLARVRRLAAQGPPHEEVGLEPFAPPELMPPPQAPELPGAPR